MTVEYIMYVFRRYLAISCKAVVVVSFMSLLCEGLPEISNKIELFSYKNEWANTYVVKHLKED